MQITLILSLVLSGVLFSLAALAEDPTPDPNATPDPNSPISTACISSVAELGPLKLQVPILHYTESRGIAEYIKEAYKASLYILVPIAIIIIIFSGIAWITAGGNQSRISQAKQYISGAFWGLALAILSYVVLSFLGLGSINDPTVKEIECAPTSEFGITYLVPLNPIKINSGNPDSLNDLITKNKNSQNFASLILPAALASEPQIPDFGKLKFCFPVDKNDIGARGVSDNFGQARIDNDTKGAKNGSRCHAGNDIYTKGDGTVLAITWGKVVGKINKWYPCSGGKVDGIFIQHGLVTINYGEVNNGSSSLAIGAEVSPNQKIGSATRCEMLHLEVYKQDVTQNIKWFPPGKKPSNKYLNDPNYCLRNNFSPPSGLINPSDDNNGILRGLYADAYLCAEKTK